MTESNPIIIGMNNPQGSEPLWPDPPGCTGWHLWQMCQCTVDDYLAGFERRNLLTSRIWLPEEAQARAPEIWQQCEGRRVILLGREVERCLGLERYRWILPQWDKTGREWRVVYHPSGRNRAYNDPVKRLMVSALLRDWLHNYGGVR